MSSESIIVIAGYGSGISQSVARKWGKQGYKVALVSRTKAKVDAGATTLAKEGIDAKGFAADLADAAAVKAVLAEVKTAFGGAAKVKIIHWNATQGVAKGLLQDAVADTLSKDFAFSVNNILVAVNAVLPDLEITKGAILVTGGAMALESQELIDATITYNASNVAIAKAAQRKTVFLLNASLAPKGIYAGQVTVSGVIKGSEWDTGSTAGVPVVDPDVVATRLAELEAKRDVADVIVHA
ncbi:NAD(P)-binding protein [Gonapodya prolifera JEL478]|uniref:NAD(P)-binding protein n=1 Tax=Gonapodya prolifera (strain JEL478) TaxID=1344416 RepID=A0A139A2P0_GONPJ|nr:NAD(P)-binding protein [Gonapodya prolifera JEL478]|eukprot:KXS10613.1 NAD(P)-binding protein [Gonapodya prolifera JEL478]